jgi:hypothetical protein
MRKRGKSTRNESSREFFRDVRPRLQACLTQEINWPSALGRVFALTFVGGSDGSEANQPLASIYLSADLVFAAFTTALVNRVTLPRTELTLKLAGLA